MNKKILIIIGVCLIVLGLFTGTMKLGYAPDSVFTFGGATNTTSTVSTTANATPVVTSGLNHGWLHICNISTSPVYLFPTQTETTTGVVVSSGIPLNPSASSTNTCIDLPLARGYIMGIASGATGTVAISVK